MAHTTVTLITFQLSLIENLRDRPQHALALMDEAFDQHGPGIYVLPEYYLVHMYAAPADTARQAESVPGPSTLPFLEWAARTGCYVVVGLLERSEDPDHPYNTAALLGPEGVIGCYRKTHLWDLGPEKEAYRECRLFRPGETLHPYEMRGWKVGVMLCADGMFPECPRVLAVQGADLILFPNSRPMVGVEAEAAARASVLPIVVSNPVGFNGVDQCLGTSRIVAPGGAIAGVEGEEEGWAAAGLDLAEMTAVRQRACQFSRRRPDLYGPLVAES